MNLFPTSIFIYNLGRYFKFEIVSKLHKTKNKIKFRISFEAKVFK